MTLKELKDKIQIREDWHESYRKDIPKFIENAKKYENWKGWDKEIFERFFMKSKDHCVASLTQGYFSEKEKEKIKANWAQLAPLLRKIAENQDEPQWDIYDQIHNTLKESTKKHMSAATNRILASLQPNLLCTIVSKDDLVKTFRLLKKYNVDNVPDYDLKAEWYKNSNQLMEYLKKNLSTKSGYDICTLPWEIKEYLETEENNNEAKEDTEGQNVEPKKDLFADDNQNHPLNLILYGPPGTGKTYNTVNEALSIIEKKKVKDLQKENREDVLKRFNQYKEEGRIVFTTFHQSLSYEEFIEGIKPIPGQMDIMAIHNNATNPTPGATQFGKGTTKVEKLPIIKYDVRPGIFKQLCDKAKNNPTEEITYSVIQKTPASSIVLTIDDLLKKFSDKVKNNGKLVVSIDGSDSDWEITKERSFRVKKISRKMDFPVTNETIKRDWDDFKSGKIKSADDIEPTRKSKQESLGTKEEHWVLYNALKDFENELLQNKMQTASDESETTETITENVPQNYVLIIDEINRGNVSQIFGELITLIEEDKRTTKWDDSTKTYIDNPEKISVTLPYSNEPFGVPGNLYIIGTMNTADRSVEALDTALRRRFDFKEMMPKPDLLDEQDCKKDWQDDLKDLLENKVKKSLKEILETINNRIRVLKDREHQIGHSYFMKCKTVEDLKNVFKNNIVPLLQEYFYGNYAYIGLVLGNGFVKEDDEAKSLTFAKFNAEKPEREVGYKLLTDEEWDKLILNMKEALDSLMGRGEKTE